MVPFANCIGGWRAGGGGVTRFVGCISHNIRKNQLADYLIQNRVMRIKPEKKI